MSEYLGRTQYGTVTLSGANSFIAVLPQKVERIPARNMEQLFSSDLSFFWQQYQTRDMYLRYFAWNFIGREGDYQGAGR